MIELLFVFYKIHIISKSLDKLIFYINNYICQNEINKLCNPDQMEKDIKNADVITCKLRLGL